MKMHLKTAHSKSNIKPRELRSQNKKNDEKMLNCDNCDYKSKEKGTLIQHIDAIHNQPWKPRLNCSQCEFVCNDDAIMKGHIEEKHVQVIIESLLSESVNGTSGQHKENSEEIEGIVEERNCPTPVPESIFICAECGEGFDSFEQVDVHIRLYHSQVTIGDQLRRLESELAFEKNQHKDKVEILEATLREVSIFKKKVEELNNVIITKDKEIMNLKSEIEQKEKENKKHTEKLNEEINIQKKQNIQSSESLRLAVLERENLRENDRILLNPNYHPQSENCDFSGTEPPLDLRPVCKFKFVRCGPEGKKQSALSFLI